VLAQEGPAHRPRFRVRVAAAGKQADGEGSSRRAAEQAAAAALLALLDGRG
jgi:ribonuclease-3